MINKNFGFLDKPRNQSDWLFGGADVWPVLQEDGQWDDYLPVKELQKKNSETMACTTFASLNVVETLILKQTGKEKNFSDRQTAKRSGTKKNGNYLFNVANSLKNDGIVGEALWQYVDGWDEYYKEIPPVVLTQAKLSKEKYAINYRWVNTNKEEMMLALKESPLAVSARYSQGENGEILNPTGIQDHLVKCYGFVEGEYWKIFDSYDFGGHLKKYDWDYEFGCAMEYKVTIKEKQPMTSPIKILKKKGAKDVGVWLPITSEEAFKSMAYSFGYEIQMVDGVIDWDKSVQGEFELRE